MFRPLLLATFCSSACGLALVPATEVDVNVVVLRLPNLEPSSAPPYVDSTSTDGAPPIDASGDVTLTGAVAGSTLSTSLTENDIDEIFEEVNRFYSTANVKFIPSVTLIGPRTSTCEWQGGQAKVEGKYKIRTHDYLVKYFGQVGRDPSDERWTNLASLVPASVFVPGKINVLYVKYVGNALQGFVSKAIFEPVNGAEIHVATIGQWSSKFTDAPIMRPNLMDCGGVAWQGITNCKLGLAFTTAHELGHLIGMSHTDPPSIMSGGGTSEADSAFSTPQNEAIQAFFAASNGGAAAVPHHPSLTSYAEQQVRLDSAATALGMLPIPDVTPGTVVCIPPSPSPPPPSAPSPPPSLPPPPPPSSPSPSPPPWRATDWTSFTSLYTSGSKTFDTYGGCGTSYLTGLHVIYDREGNGDIDRYNFELLCADGTKDYMGPYDVSRDAADWANPTSESTVRCEDGADGTANYATGLWGDRWRRESGDYDYFEFGLYCADGSFRQTLLGHSGSMRSDGSAKCQQTSGDVPAAVTNVNIVKYRKSSGDWDFYDFRVRCGAPPTVLLTYQTCSLETNRWAESSGPVYTTTSDSTTPLALDIPTAGQGARMSLVSFTSELTFTTQQTDGWCVEDVRIDGKLLLGPDGNVPSTVWVKGPTGADRASYTFHAQV